MISSREEKLIAQLCQGDEKAFAKLYASYRAACKSWLEKHFGRNQGIFEDVYQDSMIILFEAAQDGKLDHLTCTVKTYLFAICRNQMLKQFKLQKRQDEQVDQVKIHLRDWLEEADDHENVAHVRTAMTHISEPCKSILTLFYYQGLSIKALTERLDYASENALKVQKNRCIKYLKEKIWKQRN